MKKAALCLFGISKLDSYQHWTKKYNLDVDYRNSIVNYREFLIDHYRREGYDVDVFISSYNSFLEKQLIKDYSPKRHTLTRFNPHESNNIARNWHYINVLNLAKDFSAQNKFTYDAVIVTRFDILFEKRLNTLRILNDKFNISFRCERDPLIDDNFYILHGKFLPTITSLLSELAPWLSYHRIYEKIIKKIRDVNFMIDGNFWVNDNPIYKLIRNKKDIPPAPKNFVAEKKIIGNKVLTITKLNKPPPNLNFNSIKDRRINKTTIILSTTRKPTTFNNTPKVKSFVPGKSAPVIKTFHKIKLVDRTNRKVLPKKIGVRN